MIGMWHNLPRLLAMKRIMIILQDAYNYKMFRFETKYVRPKYSDGTMPDFELINKDEHSTSWSWLGSGFVEGNSWQYTDGTS